MNILAYVLLSASFLFLGYLLGRIFSFKKMVIFSIIFSILMLGFLWIINSLQYFDRPLGRTPQEITEDLTNVSMGAIFIFAGLFLGGYLGRYFKSKK